MFPSPANLPGSKKSSPSSIHKSWISSPKISTFSTRMPPIDLQDNSMDMIYKIHHMQKRNGFLSNTRFFFQFSIRSLDSLFKGFSFSPYQIQHSLIRRLSSFAEQYLFSVFIPNADDISLLQFHSSFLQCFVFQIGKKVLVFPGVFFCDKLFFYGILFCNLMDVITTFQNGKVHVFRINCLCGTRIDTLHAHHTITEKFYSLPLYLDVFRRAVFFTKPTRHAIFRCSQRF